MKKIILSAILASACFAGFNAETPKGGFTGELAVVSIENAKALKDDSIVTLQGNITKALGDEKYEFTDGKSVVVIEIDDKVWNGVEVGVNDKIEIYGEVDKKFGKTEIDVKRLKKI